MSIRNHPDYEFSREILDQIEEYPEEIARSTVTTVFLAQDLMHGMTIREILELADEVANDRRGPLAPCKRCGRLGNEKWGHRNEEQAGFSKGCRAATLTDDDDWYDSIPKQWKYKA